MLKDRNQSVVLNSVFCDAICANGTPSHLQKFLRSQIFRDKTGSCWCPEHRNRGELLNWAAEYEYPAIMFVGQMRYAIGVEGSKHNGGLWKAAVVAGSDDMIVAVMGKEEVQG